MTDTTAAVSGNGADGTASYGRSPIPDSSAASSAGASRSTGSSRTGGSPIPGHVSIAQRVLTKVGSAVVAETLGVDRDDVRVDANDDGGKLALRVETPLAIPALTTDIVVPDGGVIGTIRSLQRDVTERVLTVTGRTVSRVDVTVTGSRLQKPEKIR